jgi:hypothetical protein
MKKIFVVSAVWIAVLMLVSCAKKETPQEKARREFANAMKQMGEAMKETGKAGGFQKFGEAMKKQSEAIQGGKIVIAEKETLKSALPKLDGWQMEEPRYRKSAFGGIETANIETDYAGGGDKTVHVKVTDIGTASAMLAPLKMVLQMKLSNENEEGYQKISDFNGTPVIEKFEKADQRTQVTLLVRDRFIVELKSSGEGSPGLLKDCLGKMDLSRLK